MPRYRLDIEYDGSAFAGWQRQKGHHTVQAAIENAIAAFSGSRVTLRGAGRTDAGVHALGQVAHFDLERDWPADTVRDAVNAHLVLAGDSVGVIEARRVASGFDARFSATARHYLYRIVNRRAPLTLDRQQAWLVQRPLDIGAMNEAARMLLGRHDFTTFRSVQCQAASPVRTLDHFEVTGSGAAVDIRASARSFLHNQVRSMVGSLKRVGEGGWTAADIARALEARDRAACGPVAPPGGLYLIGVDYRPGSELAEAEQLLHAEENDE